ncbi:cell division protein FtsX [Defluviimonas salinarum]|uniref:Cell division protein FtsX n=1 Tax=Defluviimonas salinarum TaxID=2992147 RepID=A0ABT3JA19_9RHOB|nr:FtsX-like permease family protein [Defluviimonas salinarum]MCW3784542.1 cell division protein FtsX [Defluviimonas salinarum]
MDRLNRVAALLTGDSRSAQVVPPSGSAAWLTVLAAAAMALLAVFALALTLATGRLAERWSGALSQTATVRISAPQAQLEAQTKQVLDILAATPGIASARAIEPAETRALLAPWFGPDLPVESLPIPQLIEVTETASGFDAEGLSLRLKAEAPGATLDDHMRWRKPLVEAAGWIRALGFLALGLTGAALAAMVTLAAQAALAANRQVIRVLRLIGARDAYIGRAFVRRFTLRAFFGALAGTLPGMAAVALLPAASEAGGFLTGLGFSGAQWLWPLAIPLVAAIVAFWATRAAAFRMLREVQ